MTRRYPAYQDSGVEWLGEVPAGWEVKRLRRFARLKTDKATTSENPVALENIESWTGRIIPTDAEFQGEGVAFDRGDILFGKLRPYLAKVAVAADRGEAVGDFHVFKPSAEMNSYYLQRHLLAPAVISVIDGSTYGSKMPRASWDFMADLPLAVPPLPEQTAIAAFLDRETTKIDALVEEQQRLIDLLREKRQAVISHSVTRGLNPAAKLKPSGVDWLGDVPEGWAVGKLGHFAWLQGGFAFPSEAFGSDGIAVVKMTNLDRGSLAFENAAYIPENAALDRVALREGDLVWGMSGSVGDTGSLGNFARVRFADLPCQLNQRVGRFVPLTDAISLDFLEFVIQSRNFYEQVLLWVTGTAQFNISSEQVQSCKIAVPPRTEQEEIVAFLKQTLEKFDTLTQTAGSAITLLQERRAALISAAVTGKIDVRGTFESVTNAA
jgi:type I restriction enzyme S subunit